MTSLVPPLVDRQTPEEGFRIATEGQTSKVSLVKPVAYLSRVTGDRQRATHEIEAGESSPASLDRLRHTVTPRPALVRSHHGLLVFGRSDRKPSCGLRCACPLSCLLGIRHRKRLGAIERQGVARRRDDQAKNMLPMATSPPTSNSSTRVPARTTGGLYSRNSAPNDSTMRSSVGPIPNIERRNTPRAWVAR